MRLPAIRGIIDRRILVNYRIDTETMAQALPEPFRPQIFNGYAIGGICLIRLKQLRPKFMPVPWGIGSENAAHRIAVEWDDAGKVRQGVYIPRRDTSSYLNVWTGGTLFPGLHNLAKFVVKENEPNYSVTMNSQDGNADVHVSGTATENFPSNSVFKTIQTASDFFEQGSLGYSDTKVNGKFDGLELVCTNWDVETLQVDSSRSSYFEDLSRFPKGSVEFDCALLMRNISHEWHGHPDLCCDSETNNH
ncbi:MAG: DUF2071 domain-containing protein [Pirellulales bacterium]|jgi:hypothetical protein